MRFYDVRIRQEAVERHCKDEARVSSIIRSMDSADPVYEGFNKKCYLASYSPDYPRGSSIGMIAIMYDNAFDTSYESVKEYALKALDIWGLQCDPALKRKMEVRECNADYAMSNMYGYVNQRASIYGKTHVQELYYALRCLSGREAPLLREDNVNNAISRTQAIEKAAATLYSDSLREEIERIFIESPQAEKRASQCCDAARHIPVHYILEGVNQCKYEPALETLLGALLTQGRLPSRHIFHMRIASATISSDRDYDRQEWLNERLLEGMRGNILILEYSENGNGSDFDQRAYSVFSEVLNLVQGFVDSLQIVFLVPPGSSELQRRIRSRFMAPLVSIHEDVKMHGSSYAKALPKLQSIAEQRGCKPDDALEALLDKHLRNKGEASLDGIIDEWEALSATTRIFPQYAAALKRYQTKPALGDRSEGKLDARERLSNLVGLEGPKELIEQMINRFKMNRKLEEMGYSPKSFTMHCAFYGSPGTGKTEVARLYGEILRDAGILQEGRVIEVSGADCFNISSAFEHAKGSVLFVDEAYAMAANPSSAIADFIAHMENCREDTVVILAGYEAEMNRLYECNKGFRSRIGFEVEFPDYTQDELYSIFQMLAENEGMSLDPAVESRVRDRLAAAGKRDDQGNARYVRKLFEDAAGMQQVRLAEQAEKMGFDSVSFSEQELSTLTVEDIDAVPGAPTASTRPAREELKELIGLEKTKELLDEQLDFASISKERRDRGMKTSFPSMHMAFLGNPGTGKTEVARLIARAYKEAGILAIGDLYECGRQDLVGQFVGSTAPKIEALFQKARGSVIFIDEAYSLIDSNQNSYGDEAITTIIDQMEKLRDEVVVIFAGYKQEMENLLSLNPGFESRIKTRIEFDDYSDDELIEILELMAAKESMKLAKGVKRKVRTCIKAGRKDEHFGNARFVRNLLEQAMLAQAVRLKSANGFADCSDDQLETLIPADFKTPAGDASRSKIGFAA